MVSYKKNLIVFLLMVFLLTILFGFSFAAERELEVPIPGLETTTLPALPDYIVAIYNFALMIIGIICFGALIYGGFRYLTSAGKPGAMTDAKDQIFSALLGLVILFSSYLILTTINPELVILGEPGEEVIGPMPEPYPFAMRLYKDADYQGDACDIGKSDKWIEDLCGAGWNDKISSIKIEDPKYVAVIHEHIDFTGKAQLIETNIPKLDAHMNDKISSITVIRKGGPGRRVTLYEDASFESREKVFSFSHPNFAELEEVEGKNFNNLASSISVERGVIALIFSHTDYRGGGRIITKDDSNFDTCDDEDYCSGCADAWELSRCGCYPLTNECWNDKVSSMQIVSGYIVTTLPSGCAGFPDTTCVAEGCEWCPKCSANYEENTWGFDTCVEPGTCSYTCSVNCDGEICPRCGGTGGLFENPWGADKCVQTGTCTHPTCSAACGGEWCPKCGGVGGVYENPWGADTCVATGTCTYPNCSIACGCAAAMVYQKKNYGGDFLGVSFSLPDLTAIPRNGDDWNDTISSIKVAPGATIVIWEHINYAGESRTLVADDSNFDTCNAEDLCSGCGTGGCYLWLCDCWNDKVSSIEVK